MLLQFISITITTIIITYVIFETVFFSDRITQPTVSKHWRSVVSHPDRPQSNHAHLTVLQYYNKNADTRKSLQHLTHEAQWRSNLSAGQMTVQL